MSKYLKFSLLEDSFTLEIPKDWKLTQKNSKIFVITFPFGKYPSLDINIEFFDDPKLKSEKDIFNLLAEGVNDIKDPKKIREDTFSINYRVKTEEENLVLWKILNCIKPRGFRLVRLSLGWVKNKEADKIINSIIEELEKVIFKIKFLEDRNKYDNLASLSYKLKNIRLEREIFWERLKISLPKKWLIDFNNETQVASVELEKMHKYQFFFEKMEINIKESNINDKQEDKTIEEFIQNITKDIPLESPSLKKTDNNNYLFLFTLKERAKEKSGFEFVLINNIWYRMKIFKNKMVIVSFILNYSKDVLEEGEIYAKKINTLISESEII